MNALFATALGQWGSLALLGVLAYVSGLGLARVALAVGRRALRPARSTGSSIFFDAAQRPLRILLASLIFRETSLPLQLAPEISSGIAKVTFSLIVFTMAWFAIRAFGSTVDWASRRLTTEREHEIHHRVLRTQLTLLRPMATVAILVVSSAAVLMQFSFVRNIGLSLLASAGIVGVVVGFAAQKPLAALVQGIQLSITQPIRIGDTVFIEKELGTIEKIHLTYVVVRLREQRMMVVPVARFLDTAFENWTLAAPDVIGSVLLYVDFTTPVDGIRAALHGACAEHVAWDHKTCSLEVTDTTEHTMVLRALVSSSDASRNWTLRCFVRERLLGFLATLDGGRHLPQERAATVSPVVRPLVNGRPALGVSP